MMFLAHVRMGEEGSAQQLLTDHCKNTARYTGRCLRGAGLEQSGTLLGLVHDCGKFKEEFQKYLVDPNGVRGSVNHTFAGTRLLLERYHASPEGMERLAAELLAFASGSHHGMFDCVDKKRNSGFYHRLTQEKTGYGECVENFFDQCVSPEEMDNLFCAATAELSQVCQRLAERCEDYAENSFQLGLPGCSCPH